MSSRFQRDWATGVICPFRGVEGYRRPRGVVFWGDDGAVRGDVEGARIAWDVE